MPNDQAGEACRPTEPAVFPVDAAKDPTKDLNLSSVKLSPPSPLGALGVATQVCGPDTFPRVILRQPFDPAVLTGIDARTVRVFRVVEDRFFQPVWDSGINVSLRFFWSRISRPGVYAPLGLPRDHLLFEMLRALARARSYRDPQTHDESKELAKQILTPFLQTGEEDIEEIRERLTHLEIETSTGNFLPGEIRLGRDAIPLPFPLPGGISFQKLKERLAEVLENWPAGLPEEVLFFPPERPDDAEPPWLIVSERPRPRPVPQPLPDEPLPTPWPPRETGLPDDRLRHAERLFGGFELFTQATSPEIFGWLFPRHWWMHHRNEEHTGDARCSAIRRTNVQALIQRSKICLDGPIVSMPCVVAGKIYVGTGNRPGATGGTFYKIDLVTGGIDASFSFSGKGDWRDFAGVGSSPAVAGNKVYFSALTGKVYCLDAATLACSWFTDLRHTDLPHDQPVDHGEAALANGWSSPLVVNNRVYVACGEGEKGSFGFVYCLDATNGKVIWLFCTNQFGTCIDNKPNVIPFSSFDPRSGSLPKQFTLATSDPCRRGASPWSAPAYCSVLNRIYIGTGNSILDDPLPDPNYASGLLSLDATTGELKGFFQPCLSDSYRPDFDLDVDVPAGPMLFTRCGKRYVCFGSKNGSFFLLDADTMRVERRRQLLPKDSAGNPFPKVDRPATRKHENKSGVFGTAALAAHLGRLFIGLGGYLEEADFFPTIDLETTPFIRAVDWSTLADAWPMECINPPKYRAAQPPVYCTENEAALSSPAVVNDVVFVSTTKPALYAFDAETGLCLWEAPGITAASHSYALGPAIYGNFVVNGIANGLSDGHLYIYSLGR
jgi:outer membrane protein assembly factor BamB